MATEPRAGAATGPQRLLIKFGRLVKQSTLATLAPDAQLREVAGRTLLVKPELPTTPAPGSVDELSPIQIVNVAARTGSHEPRRHDLATVEAAPVVQRLAVHEPARPFALATRVVLHDEPLRKPPSSNPDCWCPWLAWRCGRRVKAWQRHSGHMLQQAGKPRLDDLLQLVGLRPSV